MIALFFASTVVVINEALPKGRKFNQGYFAFWVLSWLMKDKR
jgi:hypothetical protein